MVEPRRLALVRCPADRAEPTHYTIAESRCQPPRHDARTRRLGCQEYRDRLRTIKHSGVTVRRSADARPARSDARRRIVNPHAHRRMHLGLRRPVERARPLARRIARGTARSSASSSDDERRAARRAQRTSSCDRARPAAIASQAIVGAAAVIADAAALLHRQRRSRSPAARAPA